jgi:hypothetical protein
MSYSLKHFVVRNTIKTSKIKIVKSKKKFKLLPCSSLKSSKNSFNRYIVSIINDCITDSFEICENNIKQINNNKNFSKWIGIIPVYSNSDYKTKKPSNKINIHKTCILLKKNTYFPIIPNLNRRDIHKHIRIYARRQLDIKKSNIKKIEKIKTIKNMDVYVIVVKSIKTICNGKTVPTNKEFNSNFTWQHQLYMYDFNKVNSPIKCINKHMLDSKSTFNILNSKINYYPHILENKKLINYNYLPHISKIDLFTCLANS